MDQPVKRKGRKCLLTIGGTVAAMVVMAGPAFACTVFKGKMTATHGTATRTRVGSNGVPVGGVPAGSMTWCPTATNDARGATGSFGSGSAGTLTITVDRDVNNCNPQGIGANQLPFSTDYWAAWVSDPFDTASAGSGGGADCMDSKIFDGRTKSSTAHLTTPPNNSGWPVTSSNITLGGVNNTMTVGKVNICVADHDDQTAMMVLADVSI